MDMKKFYDITLTIDNNLPTWPGDPELTLERVNKIEEGRNANVSRLDMGVHTGTHVDAPFHFLQEGNTVENLNLDVLIGPVQVVQIADKVDFITAEVIKNAGLAPGIERVLFKTRSSKYWHEPELKFHTDFVAITEDGAKLLVNLGVRFVGLDYLSIAPYKQSRPTHEVFLKREVIILEGADLTEVPPGIYRMLCLPLKLGNTDGAPARVVLETI